MALFSAVMPSQAIAAQTASRMDEENFRLFYERTARSLRAYLCKMLGDISKADDLLQESYLRLLQTKLPPDMTEEHRKNYLFRIATNLLRDEGARRKPEPLGDYEAPHGFGHSAEHWLELGHDMKHLLGQLPRQQRELLWLAYVERFSHQEIAAVVGAKTPSIRPMLARARTKLSEILRAGGFSSGEETR
jgi:RNA polymerase sigma-70 factor, ECF subfamily